MHILYLLTEFSFTKCTTTNPAMETTDTFEYSEPLRKDYFLKDACVNEEPICGKSSRSTTHQADNKCYENKEDKHYKLVKLNRNSCFENLLKKENVMKKKNKPKNNRISNRKTILYLNSFSNRQSNRKRDLKIARPKKIINYYPQKYYAKGYRQFCSNLVKNNQIYGNKSKRFSDPNKLSIRNDITIVNVKQINPVKRNLTSKSENEMDYECDIAMKCVEFCFKENSEKKVVDQERKNPKLTSFKNNTDNPLILNQRICNLGNIEDNCYNPCFITKKPIHEFGYHGWEAENFDINQPSENSSNERSQSKFLRAFQNAKAGGEARFDSYNY